jgi:signal transduction histidine kinase
VLQPKVLDLNTTVTSAQSLLERLIREDVELACILDPDLERVEADPGQLEQVIVNLAVNARDAMPEGGKLTIETANVELSAEYAASHVEVEPGPYVLLAVSDTRTGVDAQTRARIFEPFFTRAPGSDSRRSSGSSSRAGAISRSTRTRPRHDLQGLPATDGLGPRIDVHVPRALTKEQARRELFLYLTTWRARHPSADVFVE